MKIIFCLFCYIFFAFQSFAAETFSISYEGGNVVRRYPENSQPVIGLALSGGGARGIAHIGVIEVLEENDIHVDRIAGTSMGSIIGGLYAAGYSTETLAHIFETIDWPEYFTNTPKRRSIYVTEKETINWPLFNMRFDGLTPKIPSSLSSGQKIISFLTWLALGPTYECGGDFDKLSIPFRSVTTDLSTGDMVVLGSGNLARAIQASSTVPLLFTPVEWEGKLLVDGGLKNNLPVNIVREMGSDFVIAVAIEESMHELKDLENPLNVADQATSILMRNLTGLSKDLADFVITPDMEKFSSKSFSNIQKLIEQGRVAAKKAMPALLDSLAERKKAIGKTFIYDIRVSPQKEDNYVSEIVSDYLKTGAENYFTDITTSLEELWKTGRYFNIQADLDEDTGILNIELKETPKKITLIFQNSNPDRLVNRIFDITSQDKTSYNFIRVIDYIDSLFTIIRSDGFSFAGVTKMELTNPSDSLTIYAKAPPITRIYFDEDLKSKLSIITREINFKVGDTFNMNKLMKSIDNLYGTNLFEWVYADVRPYNGGVGLGIHLSEKDWTVARVGLRFDETNNAEGRIALSRENILGFGNQFTAVGHSGKRKKLIMLQNKNDRIYKTFYTFDLKTYKLLRNRQDYPDHSHFIDYEDERYGTTISLGQQMDKFGNAVLKFKTETVRTHFSSSAKRKNRKMEIRSIIMQSLIDSFDRYPFPKNGKINLIFIESSNEFFGGTEQFVKIYWGGSYVKTIARKHTVSGSFSLGTADPSTPKIESFTLGGNPSRVNCYDFESAMSHYYSDFQGLNDEEKYGNYLAVGKFTYRLFIPRYFYLDIIYNIGNVWDNNETITFDSLLQSYGIRGSFATYLGPFSFGWGITSEGDERIQMSAGWEF
ncbi:MAG TPA: hypothetical protein ENH82_12835 [bacterium]|nr:hypothetical protein [bacterium]